ncbi:MAG: hypothetical protein F7B59_06740 [Desulfurococcales archaeon]|nr:hypothetical protein [Desulfurococcales archaeon]
MRITDSTGNRYVINIKGLEEISAKSVNPYSTIVIGGHPGAGKTILSTTICRDNMDLGHKCLYISLQEEKSRFFRVLEGIGLELEQYEKMGLFRFVKLPITLDIEGFMDALNSLILNYSPNIIVIDSITPAIESVNGDAAKRAIIQNFLYNISQLIHGLVILLAELPIGEEELHLGNIEFIADVLLLLKYKLERGLMIRELEIKKARGAPIRMAQIPFTITERGFRTFYITPPQDIKASAKKTYNFSIPFLKEYFGFITGPENILITCNPDSRSAFSILVILDLLVTNDLKGLIVTYRYSPDEGRDLIKAVLEYIGLNPTEAEELIDKHMRIVSVNPSDRSMDELFAHETMLIEKTRPDLVMFHGVEIFNSIIDQQTYFRWLLNQVFSLKEKGLIVARYMNFTDEAFYRKNASFADLIVRGLFTRECGAERFESPDRCFYLFMRGKKPVHIPEPVALSQENIRDLREAMVKSLYQHA